MVLVTQTREEQIAAAYTAFKPCRLYAQLSVCTVIVLPLAYNGINMETLSVKVKLLLFSHIIELL